MKYPRVPVFRYKYAAKMVGVPMGQLPIGLVRELDSVHELIMKVNNDEHDGLRSTQVIATIVYNYQNKNK